MIRVFTQSPDMIADMIWIHFITLSYQCLQNLSTRGHDMVDEVLFKKKRRFSLTKTTSTKIGDEMKTYDRGFLKALLWLGFPQRFLVHILRGGGG